MYICFQIQKYPSVWSRVTKNQDLKEICATGLEVIATRTSTYDGHSQVELKKSNKPFFLHFRSGLSGFPGLIEFKVKPDLN